MEAILAVSCERCGNKKMVEFKKVGHHYHSQGQEKHLLAEMAGLKRVSLDFSAAGGVTKNSGRADMAKVVGYYCDDCVEATKSLANELSVKMLLFAKNKYDPPTEAETG